MKQVLLSAGGDIQVYDVPVPQRFSDAALVRNAFSIISSGTEGSAVTKHSGARGLYEKATASQARVEQVWNMAKTGGVLKTYAAVKSKLKEYAPIGYSSAGVVVETDTPQFPFQPGTRVACMGAGLANHAEYAAIPRNLMAKVPDGVALEEAAFAAIACIAMQGIRRLDLSPGESIGVIGLGLIGQITVRLLAAMGYSAFAADLDPSRVADATEVSGVRGWVIGQDDGQTVAMEATGGVGLDGVIICAATESDAPVNSAFDLLRPRGRVSIVGDVGLGLERAKMYRKELELRLSCSYGPGRYDDAYEMRGQDYPIAHARWTEGRNLAFFLDLLGSGRLSLASLVTKTFPIDDAKAAYASVKEGGVYGVALDYKLPETPTAPDAASRTIRRKDSRIKGANDRVGLGIIGVGSFARGMHLPNAQKLDSLFDISGMASRGGATAAAAAERYDAEVATTDYRVLLDDDGIDAVLIGTRHAAHAQAILAALDAGKHVYVEKPMTTTIEDGEAVLAKAEETGLIVRVGFNRRFAPMLRDLRDGIGGSGVRALSMRVDIGPVGDDWSNTAEEGGRFLGEATHFLDFANWFMGGEPVSMAGAFADAADLTNPNGAVTLGYGDGCMAQLIYTSLGSGKMGKEHFDAFGSGRTGRVDDYTALTLSSRKRASRNGAGDKGQLEALREFGEAVRGNPRDGADARAGLAATRMAVRAREIALGSGDDADSAIQG